jgi:quinol monooxygenase YgiN
MPFMQLIEYETEHRDELDEVFDEWVRTTEGKRTATHEIHTRDRDRPGHFVDIVEFPSYEQAMRNNDLPETRRIAERMRRLCSGEPRFVNLEVLREDQY